MDLIKGKISEVGRKCLENEKCANMMDAIPDQVLISQEVRVGFVLLIRHLK
jgi:hypothetical protein